MVLSAYEVTGEHMKNFSYVLTLAELAVYQKLWVESGGRKKDCDSTSGSQKGAKLTVQKAIDFLSRKNLN